MFNKQTYVNRRKRLLGALKKQKGLILFLGNNFLPYNYSGNIYDYFRQDSNFLYFFGLNKPSLAAVIDLENGESTIFGNDLEVDDIIWHGPKTPLQELAESVGITKVKPFSKLEKVLTKKKRMIHILPQYHAEHKILLHDLLGIKMKQLKNTGDYTSEALIKAVIGLRNIKDAEEIAHLEVIMKIARQMHVLAMRMTKPGVSEMEIWGQMVGLARSVGGNISFPIILSQKGQVLHNHDHSGILKDGNMLLVDAGFESSLGYATDHTRTFPVNGTFSNKQEEIYNIVWDAKKAVERDAKPGVKYSDMHLLAAMEITKGLKDLGLMKGDIDEAVKSGAHALFFPHGLGHAMGLDVHDMEGLGEQYVGYGKHDHRSDQFGTAYLRFARTLKPGHVVTNEPGIYFIPELIDQWKVKKLHINFINYEKVEAYRDFGGIRLEDDLVITKTRNKVLGSNLIPISPEEYANVIGKEL